jgi:hypothetical protein
MKTQVVQGNLLLDFYLRDLLVIVAAASGYLNLKVSGRSQLAQPADVRRRSPMPRNCGYRGSRAIRRAIFELRLSFLTNYIQTMVNFCLNYY